MDTDSEPPSPRDTPTEPAILVVDPHGDEPIHSSKRSRKTAEGSFSKQIDNNIDDNYNAMIAVDDVDFERFDISTYKTVSSRRLRKWPLCEDRIMRSSRSSRTLLKASTLSRSRAQSFTWSRWKRKSLWCLEEPEDDALKKYDEHQQREVAEARDELLHLPILVRRPCQVRPEPRPPERGPTRIQNRQVGVFSGQPSGRRLEGSYHDYVYSMMLFRFRKASVRSSRGSPLCR